MSLDKVNSYSAADTDPTNLMATVDAQRIGKMDVSLTEYATNVKPEVAEGSELEINGAIFKANSDQAIGGAPGDGLVYIKVIPAGATATAEFTAVAPVWDTEKQGWYEPATNNRYLNFAMTKSGVNYSDKYEFNKFKECIRFMADGDVNIKNNLNLGGTTYKNGVPIYGFDVNGLNIFAKRYSITISTGNTVGSVAHGISGNIGSNDKILHITGVVTNVGGYVYDPYASDLNVDAKIIGMYCNNTNLYIKRSGTGIPASYNIVLVYIV